LPGPPRSGFRAEKTSLNQALFCDGMTRKRRSGSSQGRGVLGLTSVSVDRHGAPEEPQKAGFR
jgi:hypothetical protein